MRRAAKITATLASAASGAAFANGAATRPTSDIWLAAGRKSACKPRALHGEEFYVEQFNRRYSRPNRCC